MIREIFPGVYVAEVETEMVGVRHLNYSFLCGAAGERSVLIDCGFPAGLDPSGAETLRRAFQELLSPAELDVLITHGHKDHLGQAQELERLGARIFVNPEDMDQSAILNTLLMGDEGRRMLFRLVGLETYDRETYEAFWSAADGFVEGYRNIWDFPYTPIHPGESRTVGDYCLEVAARAHPWRTRFLRSKTQIYFQRGSCARRGCTHCEQHRRVSECPVRVSRNAPGGFGALLGLSLCARARRPLPKPGGCRTEGRALLPEALRSA